MGNSGNAGLSSDALGAAGLGNPGNAGLSSDVLGAAGLDNPGGVDLSFTTVFALDKSGVALTGRTDIAGFGGGGSTFPDFGRDGSKSGMGG